MDITIFENEADALLKRFDPEGLRKRRLQRPFMIELFGTPKSGKSTIKEMLKHFLKRNGWAPSTPQEGAEVVEFPRDEPEYNFQTCEYALSIARARSHSKDFHIVIFDRAIFDGVARMDHYAHKGIITLEEQRIIEGYYLNRWNRDLFDMHICLLADPETAIQRELARALSKKDGETMNPTNLRKLLDTHHRVLNRFQGDPKLRVHDSTKENEGQTATAVLEAIFEAFNRRLDPPAECRITID